MIDKECAKENETFKLKAKGDEMKIWCSTIEESGSTGTNPFLRNKGEGYGALSGRYSWIDCFLKKFNF